MPRPSPQFSYPRLLIFFLAVVAGAGPQARADDWQIAADAAHEGHFEAASGTLEKILRSAIAAGNATDAARAILLRIQADSSREKQDGSPLWLIEKLTALLDETQMRPPLPRVALPAATIPILHYALASQYGQLIHSRPSPANGQRYSEEAMRHYQLALANPALLQATPIEALEPLVVRDGRKSVGTNIGGERPFPDICRPTLYDFLVFEAIHFYDAALDHGFVDAENLPALPSGPQHLAPLDSFLSWEPASEANWATIVTLHQSLLRFHQSDPAPRLALAGADLRRITWAASLLSGLDAQSKVDQLHEAALRSFIDQWRNVPGVPAVATACAELAALLFDSSPDAAHVAATEGARLYPDSPDAARCRNLIAQLEAPDLIAIAVEHSWNAPWPDMTIIHRNIPQVHFRAVPCEWEDFFKNKHGFLNRIPKEDLDALLKLNPAKAWSVTFPASPGRNIREEKYSTASAARSLKPGFYFVIASADKEFSSKGSRIFCAPVWVSDLAIVHTPTDDGRFTGYVVDALTGNPVSGASVTVWLDTTNTINGRAITSNDGAFSIFPIEAPQIRSNAHNCYLIARAPDRRAIASGFALKPNPASPFEPTPNRAFFYTDRSVYYPGETIHYKILAVNKPAGADRPVPLVDYEIPIQLRAPGAKWTDSHIVRTNAFGSASGSFILPATNAPGAYDLSSDFQKVMGSALITVIARAAALPSPSVAEPVETMSISAEGLLTTTAPVTLAIEASGDGNPISVSGTLSIRRLKESKKTSRKPLLHFRNPSVAKNETPADIPLEKPHARLDFATDSKTGIARVTARLPAGIYRVAALARGASGKTITASTVIRVFNPKARRSPIREDISVEARSWEVRPGETFKAIWSAGGKNVRACFTFEQDGRIIRRLWTQPGVTQQTLEFPIAETMRGGVCLRVFQVNDNRFVARRHDISVPHENQLAVNWDRSNTPPRAGSSATWTASIQKSDTTPADAEVAAVLYDDALDPFFRHEWPALAGFFRHNNPGHDFEAATNTVCLFHRAVEELPPELEAFAPETHRHWNTSAVNLPGRRASAITPGQNSGQSGGVSMMDTYTVTDTRLAIRKKMPGRDAFRVSLQPDETDPDGTACILSLVKPPDPNAFSRSKRTLAGDNAATAVPAHQASPATFFFPALRTGKDGKLRITFDVPDNMARSKLMLFAHDRQLNFTLFVRNFVKDSP